MESIIEKFMGVVNYPDYFEDPNENDEILLLDNTLKLKKCG